MKPTIILITFLVVGIFSLTSGQSKSDNSIFGKWKILDGKHNGVVSPKVMMDRFQYFNANQTFQSVINLNDGKQATGNSGNFYLLNDSTIVTYHRDQSGKLDNVANTYFFRIKDEHMHFYGYYLSHSAFDANTLTKVYIDEWWERVK